MVRHTPFVRFVTLALSSAALATLAARGSDSPASGSFKFEPLPSTMVCNAVPGDTEQPFILPPGYAQTVIAREGDCGSTDEWDQNVLNETGPHPGRFLYRAHEVSRNGQVTVTDLETGSTSVLAQRQDWNRLDGTVWTPWGTLLTGEELRRGRTPFDPDPMVPQALAGLIYEIDAVTGASVARPALGAKPHEGIRFGDPHELRRRAHRHLLRQERDHAVRERAAPQRRRSA